MNCLKKRKKERNFLSYIFYKIVQEKDGFYLSGDYKQVVQEEKT